MKRQSVLNKQSVKKQKKRDFFAVFRVIPLIGSGLLKVLFVVAGIAAISLSFVFLYSYLLSSPYMKLKQVDMEGIDRKIRHELIQACGLSPDLSLLELNLNELRQKMETHPWIRSAKLIRRFPNTLIVRAEKESPSALVLMEKVCYMNRWGEVIKEVNEWEDMDFPVITGVSEKDPKTLKEQLEKAALILKTLEPENGLWSLNELSEIHINRDGRMSIYFNHMTAEIKLMSYDLQSKMEGLKRVAEHLRRTGRIHQVTSINLNRVDGAVVSFKKG
ncbi:MAG: FtsQ-type POTRA domain-containing protein [Deltaproteobacteria bacterium]|nr:FtsQ-type POTRA domain-containing protein [Deltaproteobacteria bacterium]